MKYRYNSILGHKIAVDSKFLIEGTINGMQKQFPKIPENIWKVILSLDPEVKGNQCGVTTRFLAQLTLNKAKQDNGFDNCEEYLLNVIKPAIAMLQEKGAIKQLGKLNVSDSMIDTKLIDLAQTLENKKEANKFAREVSVIKKSLELGAQEIYNSNRYLVLIPWTEESSKVFRDGEGNNTLCVWCTAWSGDNRWAYYMSMGNPLKIVFDKKTGKLYQHSNAKEEWAGFRDQHNNSADMKEIITDEDVINCLLNDDMNLYSKLADEVLKKFADSINDVDKQVLEMYKTQSFITIDEFGNEYEPEREYDDDDDYEDEDEEPLDDYEYAISEVIGTTDENELEKYTAYRTDDEDEDELINERLIKDLKRNPDVEWILQHNEEFHIVDIETLIADRAKAVDEYLEKITPEKIKEKCRKLKIDTWMRTKRGIKAELRKKLIGTQSRCIQRAIQENTGAPGINMDAFIKNYMNTHTREELLERDPYYKGEYDEFVVFKD